MLLTLQDVNPLIRTSRQRQPRLDRSDSDVALGHQEHCQRANGAASPPGPTRRSHAPSQILSKCGRRRRMSTPNIRTISPQAAPERRVFHLATLTTAEQNGSSRTSAPMITRFDRTLGVERHVRALSLVWGQLGSGVNEGACVEHVDHPCGPAVSRWPQAGPSRSVASVVSTNSVSACTKRAGSSTCGKWPHSSKITSWLEGITWCAWWA